MGALQKGLTRNANALQLAATILLVAAVGLMTWFQYARILEARLSVRHTNEVILTTRDLAVAVRDAETGQREYLLSGEPDYLTPYRNALERIPLLEGQLGRLTADDSTQQERLHALALLIRRKLDELAQAVDLRSGGKFAAAPPTVHTNLEHLIDEVEKSLAGIKAGEERLLGLREAAVDHAETVNRWLAVGGTALAVGLLALAARLLALAQAKLWLSEDEQRAMARHVRTAFDSISQGIGVFSPDGGLVRWNKWFTVLLGLPAPIMRQGMPYETIGEQVTMKAGTKGPFLETEDQIHHGRGGRSPGEPVVYERTRATEGRSLELRRTAMPDGGFVLTATDITERVRAEATARDAQRLQAMGQLTGGIAHDFNNLLTIVMGNLELATSELEEGSPVLPRIERAMWGAKRGASLTQHLLAFARKQALAPMPMDLSSWLPDMLSLLRRTLGEQIDFRSVDSAGLWAAMADPTQVETALLNLALNARDAMPGGGRLTIELANKVLGKEYARQHTEVVPGDYVMLAVSDTGTGMPPEVLARVFEPFFTTKGPGQGCRAARNGANLQKSPISLQEM